MKKAIFTFSAAVMLLACNKSNEASTVTLTPSTTQVGIGEQLSVRLSSTANVSNWTVTPSVSASKTFGLTTSKVNYFSFSQPGLYTIAVRVKNLTYDSTLNQSLDSCWRSAGGVRGGCGRESDTASISIMVVNK